jgi:hypothetical protein
VYLRRRGHPLSGPDARPAPPTRDFCLVPPRTLRWEGEVEVEPRLWHLLGLILEYQGKPVPFDVVDDRVRHGKDASDRCIMNDVSSLSGPLLDIHFPWELRTENRFIVVRPGRR